MRFPSLLLALVAAAVLPTRAAITISGISDKIKYPDTVTFTVTADPAAVTTTATLDGVATTVGSAVTVTSIRYHELKAESRDGVGALVDSRLVRFIVHDSDREGSEDGIPPHTPFRSVPDAPSAFVGKTLKVAAPAAWPVGMPVPLAVMLRDGADESVWLNGVVKFGGFPQTTTLMRRGWGSVQIPAATAAGTVDIAANVNSLHVSRAITFEAAPAFTTVSGALASNTAWPANSRIHVTGTLTVNAGVTLTVGAGTIVKIFTGTATNGSAAEIRVDGALQVNGTETNPVVFCPDTPGQQWGGIELRAATSLVNAQHAIFTGSGEDENWFSNNPGVGGSSHQGEQVLFLVAGSGSGTNYGAQLHLANCFCIDNSQIMNAKTNTWVDLSRTLYQRAITSGELNGCKVTIDRSALIEFPSETANFVNDDNDAIYFTNGDLTLTNTVIGFTKDDGVDSGGDGGDNPYTAAADITPYLSQNNWYEGTTHEGNSLSGTRDVNFIGCVFLNCGQGVEAGYSAGSLNGPNATVDGCLFVSNMVGVRWGDNYGSGYTYNATHEVKNSFVLNSFYKDCFSGNWHPTAANAWIYQTAALNTFGRQYFNVHNNYLSQPDPVHHPANTTWNPAVHGALLAPFMPVPGSNVGVAISSYAPAQSDTSAYVGTYTVRLSTFSSKTVTVDWAVVGKVDQFGPDMTLLTGTLTFAPGETLKTINAAFPGPNNYAFLHVKLMNPTNAEVTGDAFYFKAPPVQPPLTFFSYGTGGTGSAGSGTPGSQWKEKSDFNTTTLAAFITNVGDTWRNEGFNDSTWTTVRTQAGYGNDDENTPIPDLDYNPATPLPTSENVPCYLFRSTFTIADVSALASVTGQIKYDDAYAIYVNGVDVDQRANLPAGTPLTSYASSTSADNAMASITIPLGVLHNGVNTIAVDMRQGNSGSSDVTFDLRLAGTPANAVPFQLNFAPDAVQPLLWWFNSAWLLEESTNLINWTPVPAGLSPYSFKPDVPKRFFRLHR
jgi:hypothetical protein